MIIFLIGFMGSGKSTVGKKLAKIMSYRFIDLDEEVEKQELATISEIFESKGENYFRTIEQKILKQQFTKQNLIVSCGGGTPCFFNNMELMNQAGCTIYLQLNSQALLNRLTVAKTKRPLLKNMNNDELSVFISEKLKEREGTYLKSKLVMKGIDINLTVIVEKIQAFAH